jgi:hypothetical protein
VAAARSWTVFFAAAFAEAAGTAPSQSTGELAERAKQDSGERRAMIALYDRMDTLPPRLQMFMAGCPAELDAKRDRINARQVVMRTVLAETDICPTRHISTES